MKIPLNARALKLYKDLVGLLVKYGRTDVVKDFGVDDEAETQSRATKEVCPADLADDLEKMGPTFVKLGQILSSRADLIPEKYIEGLERLQDKVKPFPYSDVERIIFEELGVRVSKGFQDFEQEPLAAASLGQVHRASLRDGRPVVVKIQRPDIRRQIAEDMEVLEEIAAFMSEHTSWGRRYQVRNIFEEFKRTLVAELDYTREAAHMEILSDNLKEFRDSIKIPLPIRDYSTTRVLTMERIEGQKITSVGPLARMELNGSYLAEQVFRAYLKQVLVDGIFHADPHPGNVFLTVDRKVALLDLGMVGRFTPGMQEQLIKILVAIPEGRGDDAADIAIRIGQKTEEFNEQEFRRKVTLIVSEQRHNTLRELDLGKTLIEVSQAAGNNGLLVPTELSLLGKTLLQLDAVGKYLDSSFNPNDAIRRNVAEILNKRFKSNLNSSNLMATALELKEFVTALPVRLNKLLENISGANFEVKVRTVDVEFLIGGFQKVANRITMGLILASLIIGAALLMQVKTDFTLFGYPGLAILCFLAAAGGGFWLVLSILLHDTQDKKKTRKQSVS
ncbi:MAG TPA: AarF/UbiB family protein [Methylomirabilota bacterium]|nr:AarF/UbiB family protein [Methylomirabilota bacterium]